MSSIRLIKFMDKNFGSLICFLLSFFNIKEDVKIRKILFIQLWGIGETVLTLPAIKNLRKRFTKAKISILLTQRNKEVYYNNKDLDNLILISLSPFSIILFLLKNLRKYDLVIDMEEYLNISAILSFFLGKRRIGYSHNIRSRLYTDTIDYNDKQHAAQTFADLLKPLDIKSKISSLENLNYSQKDKKIVDKILPKGNYICLVPGTAESAKSRMWPKEKFAELANHLIKKRYKIIFTGSDSEKGLIEKVIKKIKDKKKIINLAGKITIRQLFYLVKRCKIVISNDTGTMHIAAAQGVKTIGLFGPNIPLRFGPLNKKSKSIYKGRFCRYSPCINVHKGEVPDCYYKGKSYQKCMKEIKVEDILILI